MNRNDDDAVWWWPLRMIAGALAGVMVAAFLFIVSPVNGSADAAPPTQLGGGIQPEKPRAPAEYRWERDSYRAELLWFLGIGAGVGSVCGLSVTKRYSGEGTWHS